MDIGILSLLMKLGGAKFDWLGETEVCDFVVEY
jgi:hypothetical protein